MALALDMSFLAYTILDSFITLARLRVSDSDMMTLLPHSLLRCWTGLHCASRAFYARVLECFANERRCHRWRHRPLFQWTISLLPSARACPLLIANNRTSSYLTLLPFYEHRIEFALRFCAISIDTFAFDVLRFETITTKIENVSNGKH